MYDFQQDSKKLYKCLKNNNQIVIEINKQISVLKIENQNIYHNNKLLCNYFSKEKFITWCNENYVGFIEPIHKCHENDACMGYCQSTYDKKLCGAIVQHLKTRK